MKLRTLVITVGLLAILSAVAYFSNRPEPAPAADPRVGKELLGSETVAKAAAIIISDQGKSVRLARDSDGSWRVPSYFDLPADFEKISRFVQDLHEAKVERFVTDSPERLAHLEFKDPSIVLDDASGKEIWSLTVGKTAESGNGRFIRFGSEPRAFFSGLHVWLDTDAKGWADARLVNLKPEEVAKIDIPFDGGKDVVVTREKKDAPWTCASAPAGQKLVAEKASSLLTSLTSLRFTDTADPKDAAASEAASHFRTFKLTTFDGKTLAISLGRKPEEKRAKPPVPPAKEVPAAAKPAEAKQEGKPAEAKVETKPAAPEFETIPAGPVFASISSSVPHASINELMKRRAFQVDEYTFTGLPQKADDLFEAAKAK